MKFTNITFIITILIMITTVICGMGKMECVGSFCDLELIVYSDNENYKNLFMEEVRISNEIMCTFQNIRITKITHINNKSNLGYADIVIYDQSYQGIIFPFTYENNIGQFGYYNGISYDQLTDINIVNVIFQFIGRHPITQEKKCYDGVNYGSLCQNNTNCNQGETCFVFYPGQSRQKSNNECYRGNTIVEIQKPTNAGVHLIIDRSAYNKFYNETVIAIKQIDTYFKEYGVNMVDYAVIPKINVTPKCMYIHKSGGYEFRTVCIHENYPNYDINLTFSYSINAESNDGCYQGYRNAYDGRWKDFNMCVFVCEKNDLLVQYTQRNSFLNPQNYYPTKTIDINQNIEPFIKTYFNSFVNNLDHLIFVTSGKFMMNSNEFAIFIDEIQGRLKKFIVFAINDGPISEQLYKLVKITNGDLYLIDAAQSQEIIKNQMQKEILKMIAKIQKKKILNDASYSGWFDTHFYSNIIETRIHIIGSNNNITIFDPRGITQNLNVSVTSINNNYIDSKIINIPNIHPGIWRFFVANSVKYDTIVLVDDIYYTGHSKKETNVIEIFPSQRMAFNAEMRANVYNVSNNALLSSVTTNRSHNGTYLIQLYDQQASQKVEILDVFFVDEPIIYISPKKFCDYQCNLLKLLQTSMTETEQPNQPTHSNAGFNFQNEYLHYIDEDQTCVYTSEIYSSAKNSRNISAGFILLLLIGPMFF
jgi:hypothetical protein